MRRLDRPTLRAAWWTLVSLRHARHQLRRDGLTGFSLPVPPELPTAAGRGVHAVLRRVPQTCLERALVLQRWDGAHGEAKDVVIGVRGPARTLSAHAWLDGELDALTGYEELLRVPAR